MSDVWEIADRVSVTQFVGKGLRCTHQFENFVDIRPMQYFDHEIHVSYPPRGGETNRVKDIKVHDTSDIEVLWVDIEDENRQCETLYKTIPGDFIRRDVDCLAHMKYRTAADGLQRVMYKNNRVIRIDAGVNTYWAYSTRFFNNDCEKCRESIHYKHCNALKRYREYFKSELRHLLKSLEGKVHTAVKPVSQCAYDDVGENPNETDYLTLLLLEKKNVLDLHHQGCLKVIPLRRRQRNEEEKVCVKDASTQTDVTAKALMTTDRDFFVNSNHSEVCLVKNIDETHLTCPTVFQLKCGESVRRLEVLCALQMPTLCHRVVGVIGNERMDGACSINSAVQQFLRDTVSKKKTNRKSYFKIRKKLACVCVFDL